ncbi:hypothetical protein OROHE_015651 [Orobanche hederae]
MTGHLNFTLHIVWNYHDRLLRQHRKETFINKWRLVTVLTPSYATEQLVTVER